MAVLRPDQSQLTFAAEGAAGADQDLFTVVANDTTGHQNISTTRADAGSTNITVADASGFPVGCHVVIGGGPTNILASPAAAAIRSIAHVEVRKVEHKEGNTLYFDRPLGFTHHSTDGQSSAVINKVGRVSTISGATSGATPAGDNHPSIIYVPGVYETVDTPDPAPTIEPRYFLGTTAKRNFTSVYTGQRTYQGALTGNVLLNGWPLRFPIGVEIPKVTGYTTGLSNSGGALAVNSFVGDTWVKSTASSAGGHGVSAGDYLVVEYEAAPTVNSLMEVRKVRSVISSNNWIELETPLKYNHTATKELVKIDTSATNYHVTHHITERTDLDSISMHVHMRDSGETAANDFDRRWIGGKVGAMSIVGEEGGLITVNWENMVFRDMLHNQARHAGVAATGVSAIVTEGDSVSPNMPGYAIMNDIVEGDIKFPVTEPYYFSGGSVKLFGTAGSPTEFARIRSFTLSVNNNEDQRFYINPRHGDHRGPSEIREQRREYSLSCTVALPDTQISTDNTIDNALSIFKELLLEGKYNDSDRKGFNISLKFIRKSAAFDTIDDAIYIDIPGPEVGATAFETVGTPNSPSSALGNAGAFLRSAPHTIMTEAPFQVNCDFVFRNLAVTVVDREPVYP